MRVRCAQAVRGPQEAAQPMAYVPELLGLRVAPMEHAQKLPTGEVRGPQEAALSVWPAEQGCARSAVLSTQSTQQESGLGWRMRLQVPVLKSDPQGPCTSQPPGPTALLCEGPQQHAPSRPQH